MYSGGLKMNSRTYTWKNWSVEDWIEDCANTLWSCGRYIKSTELLSTLPHSDITLPNGSIRWSTSQEIVLLIIEGFNMEKQCDCDLVRIAIVPECSFQHKSGEIETIDYAFWFGDETDGVLMGSLNNDAKPFTRSKENDAEPWRFDWFHEFLKFKPKIIGV